jgi:hypothetical protein
MIIRTIAIPTTVGITEALGLTHQARHRRMPGLVRR